jgi:nitrogen-specific signal transduction histidine kinase
MLKNEIILSLLNSIREPILFADKNHITQFMNQAAVDHYSEGIQLMNKSLLKCHNEESCKAMIEILQKMENGLTEELISSGNNGDIYMRAVRDSSGNLIGYYERYANYTPDRW